MNRVELQIEQNIPLTDTTWRMTLLGDTTAITAPGQFVNIALSGRFLRRPISACDWEEGRLTIIYKVVGAGTRQMSRMQPGDSLDVLLGLGNGYDCSKSGQNPVLLGGGVGVPPLYGLCKRLLAEGKQPTVILGFNTANERFYEAEFSALGVQTLVTTVDGSYGCRGFVTDALPADYSYFYACGPEPMLCAVCKVTASSGQLSFEQRMGCGFGGCMGCTCETLTGYKRICKEGPVLEKEEILW